MPPYGLLTYSNNMFTEPMKGTILHVSDNNYQPPAAPSMWTIFVHSLISVQPPLLSLFLVINSAHRHCAGQFYIFLPPRSLTAFFRTLQHLFTHIAWGQVYTHFGFLIVSACQSPRNTDRSGLRLSTSPLYCVHRRYGS